MNQNQNQPKKITEEEEFHNLLQGRLEAIFNRKVNSTLLLLGVTYDRACALAKKHLKAVKPKTYDNINLVRSLVDFKSQQRDKSSSLAFHNYFNHCQCCKQLISQPISLNIDIEQLGFMGQGILSLFSFSKFIINSILPTYVLLSLFSIISSVINANRSEVSLFCKEEPYCYFQIIASGFRQTANFQAIQSWLGFSLSLLFIVISELFRFKCQQIFSQQNSYQTTPSDYSVLIQNLPALKYSKKKLLKKLQEQIKIGSKLRCDQIYMVIPAIDIKLYDFHQKCIDSAFEKLFLQKLVQMREKKKTENRKSQSNIIEKKQYNFSEINQDPKVLIQRNISQLEKLKDSFLYIKKFQKHFSDKEITPITTYMAVLIFKEKSKKRAFIEEYGSSRTSFFGSIYFFLKFTAMKVFNITRKQIIFEQRQLKFYQACQPQEIIEQNCVYQYSFWRLFGYWMLTFFALMVCLAINLGFQFLISYLQQRQLTSLQTIMRYVEQGVVIILNMTLNILIGIFVNFERHYTKTDQLMSFTSKALISVVLNSTFIPLITNLVIKSQSIYQESGLVFTVFSFALTNSIVPNLILFFKPGYLIAQFLLSLKCCLQVKYLNMSQKQFNELFNPPQIDYSQHYQYILNFLFFSSFYLTVQPLILIFLFAGLIFRFFLLKYLVLRRYKRPQKITSNYFRTICDNLDFVVIFYATGAILKIMYETQSNITRLLPPIILAGIGLLKSVFYRFKFFLRMMRKIGAVTFYQQVQNKSYSEVKFKNGDCYSRGGLGRVALSVLDYGDCNYEDEEKYKRKMINILSDL